MGSFGETQSHKRHLVDALEIPLIDEKWLAKKVKEKDCSPGEKNHCSELEASVQAKCHQGTCMPLSSGLNDNEN